MDKKKDLEIQIPTQAWVSIFAIMDIDSTLKTDPDITLTAYLERQKNKTNIWTNNPNIPIYNIGTLAMMSYVLLVLPKEVIEYEDLSKEDKQVIKRLLDKFNIKSSILAQNLSNEENILRHIRNAIAHVNYELNEDGDKLIFLDYNKNNKTFEGEISVLNYQQLIQNYFKIYYKKYLESF